MKRVGFGGREWADIGGREAAIKSHSKLMEESELGLESQLE